MSSFLLKQIRINMLIVGVVWRVITALTSIANAEDGAYMPGNYANACDSCESCSGGFGSLIEFEMLALRREAENEVELPSNSPGTTFSSGNFGNVFDAGIRLRYQLPLTIKDSLEFCYAGNLEWSDTLRKRDAWLSQHSSFDNAELNWVHFFRTPNFYVSQMSELSALIGLRYTGINDELKNGIGTQTDNDLFGLQIGLQSKFAKSRFTWIDVETKAGIFNADMSVDTTGGALDGTTIAPGRNSLDRTAWGGNLGIRYHYNFAPSFNVVLGYCLYAYSGVALADRNLNRALSLGFADLDSHGAVLYHGPTFGLTWVR